MDIQRILALFFSFLAFTTVYSKEYVVLDKSEDVLVGGEYIELFEDKSGTLTFEEIQSNKVPFRDAVGNFSATQNASSNYWIRFKIQGAEKGNKKWVLEILDSRQDELILYKPSPSGSYSSSHSGMLKGYSNREYKHKNIAFDLDLKSSSEHYYYLRVKSKVITSLLFKIRTLKNFSQYGFSEYYLLGLYYGILIMMTISSLFLFLNTREKSYLYYQIYTLIWIYISMIKDGTGFQYLWSDYYYVSIIGYYLSDPLLIVAFVIYSLNFLSFSSYPKLRKVIIGMVAIYLLLYFVGTPFNYRIIENIFFYSPLLLIYYISILNYREGFKPARYFLLGNSMVLFSLIVVNLRDTGQLAMLLYNSEAASIIAVYITNICMVLEITILSFAIADRVKFLKKEQEATQLLLIEQLKENQRVTEKVNRELETKVKERTIAIEEKTKMVEEKSLLLEEANKKLVVQAEEINKMNAMLDVDNWNLKKNIMEIRESRIILKDISFEDFKQVYPDDASVFKYLEELKWGNHYACAKCGNSNYRNVSNAFTRHCSTCGNEESVTANTLFHKCKFPINKALFIVTTINRKDEDFSISNLANELELRYATCWSFVQKVMAIKENNKYNSLPNDKKLAFLIMGE